MSRPEPRPDAGGRRHSRRRRAGAAFGAAAIVLVILFLLRGPILTSGARFLTVQDPLHPADAIVLLNGGLDTRPAAAAALYARDLAPIIVLAREEESPATTLGLMPNRSDVSIGLLRHGGVPHSAIRQLRAPGGSTSTRDEARIFLAYARMHAFRRIILVTSDYHTRRTRRAFREALGPLEIELLMAPVPGLAFDASDWWKTESGLLAVFEEYVKLVRDVLTD